MSNKKLSLFFFFEQNRCFVFLIRLPPLDTNFQAFLAAESKGALVDLAPLNVAMDLADLRNVERHDKAILSIFKHY